MGVKSHVFASNAERKNFYQLSRQWGDQFRLHHNLPFLQVFNLENLKLLDTTKKRIIPKFESIRVGDIQLGRLKKTSIDYTFCDDNDRPIACIEFDGLNDGYNVGTKYFSDTQPDRWRQTITELKLRIAHASAFPFFVVGYDVFRELSTASRLAIIDGIIGEVLASTAYHEKINSGFLPERVGLTPEVFERLPRLEKTEAIEFWMHDCESTAKYEHNPIYRRYCDILQKLAGRRIKWKLEYLSPSSQPSNFVGCKCAIEVDGKSAAAKVWMQQFQTPGFPNSWGLCEHIAELLAIEQFDPAVV